ncbi:hypothetical protein ILYODFUR_036974 [Ilyodon furcidens]|uniref:Uncharacterized protein n=1 Tax=Ilyodon furcidens TaxID=33524 RepID=A0ABV0U249_9TELE
MGPDFPKSERSCYTGLLKVLFKLVSGNDSLDCSLLKLRNIFFTDKSHVENPSPPNSTSVGILCNSDRVDVGCSPDGCGPSAPHSVLSCGPLSSSIAMSLSSRVVRLQSLSRILQVGMDQD